MCVRLKDMTKLILSQNILNDRELIMVSKDKYLGVIIAGDCNDNEAAIRQMRSIYMLEAMH